MDIIERMKRSIINSFPAITERELKSRIELAIHMIAIERRKNK